MAAPASLLLSFFFFFFIVFPIPPSSGSPRVLAGKYDCSSSDQNFSLGVIVDDFLSSAGMEVGVAMGIAVEDFCAATGGCYLGLHRKSSRGNPVRAARNLIKYHHVKAIVSLGSVPEAAAIAELGNRSNVTILSLANEIPSWVSRKWHFLVNAAHSQRYQMEAIAAILQSRRSWGRANIIYEDDVGSASFKSTLPSLISALQDVGVEVNDLLALPPSPQYYSLPSQLKRLERGLSRVFIVHTSLNLAAALFREAKVMGMMESREESVWITTSDITDPIDTLDPTSISSMQGVVGVRTYFPHGRKKLEEFRTRFRSISRAQSRTPKQYIEPGIPALQAYDAVRALALAIHPCDESRTGPIDGQALLNKILNSSFMGLTGPFKFVSGSLEPAKIFQLVNFYEKGYGEIGFWTKGLGFSKDIGEDASYSSSMDILGQILWPGRPLDIPRGWVVPTKGNKLKIGVPLGNSHKEFVNASYGSPGANLTVTGFSVDVFNATVLQLPYHLEYEFRAFDDTYDSLVQRVSTNEIDGVVADTAIVANRYQYAEFSQPYTDSDLQILIYIRPTTFGRAWLILRPFTITMWVAIILLNILCGLTVYVIEQAHHKDAFRGGTVNQTLVMLTLSFTTLFSLQGRKLHSNLSRMTMVIWLFVALVVTQTYTASLSSFLTAEKLTPVDVTVESLVRDRVNVGCDEHSFVVKHLEVRGFSSSNIKTYVEDGYAHALRTGEIKAAFLESPHARVFLAKNCKGFTTAEQTVKVGGFGFVFAKNSPYVPDISEAVLKITENGTIRDLEKSMLSSYNCPASKTDSDKQPVGVESFIGLFGLTTAISIVSLLLFAFRLAPDNTSDVSDEKREDTAEAKMVEMTEYGGKHCNC